VFNLKTKKSKSSIIFQSHINRFVISKDGTIAASTTNKIEIASISLGVTKQSLKIARTQAAKFSPSGKNIVYATEEKITQITLEDLIKEHHSQNKVAESALHFASSAAKITKGFGLKMTTSYKGLQHAKELIQTQTGHLMEHVHEHVHTEKPEIKGPISEGAIKAIEFFGEETMWTSASGKHLRVWNFKTKTEIVDNLIPEISMDQISFWSPDCLVKTHDENYILLLSGTRIVVVDSKKKKVIRVFAQDSVLRDLSVSSKGYVCALETTGRVYVLKLVTFLNGTKSI